MSNALYWDEKTAAWQPKGDSPYRFRSSKRGMGIALCNFDLTADGMPYVRSRRMPGWKNNRQQQEDMPPFDEAKAKSGGYTSRELEFYTDQILREAAAAVDPTTGKQRGIGGDHPILFPEHEYARKRREIYTEGGTPDPSLVQGIYNRTHPQGRKVNSPEQRRTNGASYYR